MALPIYNALPDGPLRDQLHPRLGVTATSVPTPEQGLELDGLPPGLLVVDGDSVPVGRLLELAATVDGDESGWVIGAAIRRVDGGVALHTVSVGRRHAPEEAAAWAADPAASREAFLALEQVLREVARARHDVNNPLTSALAETQLALLDAPEGDLRESLEVIQGQLRRIRDLVAATGHLRPPRE